MNTDDNTILLASDDPTTQILIQDAMKQVSLDHVNICVFVVKDGHEALHYLESKVCDAQYKHYVLPIVILIDINIPVLSGLELLECIKRNSKFNHIPVVVMSNSEDEKQVMEAMNLGASSYFVKSKPIKNLIYLIKALVPWLLQDYSGN